MSGYSGRYGPAVTHARNAARKARRARPLDEEAAEQMAEARHEHAGADDRTHEDERRYEKWLDEIGGSR